VKLTSPALYSPNVGEGEFCEVRTGFPEVASCLWWKAVGPAGEKREEGGRSSDASLHDAVRLHPGGLGDPH
jgi:hypothetical protein